MVNVYSVDKIRQADEFTIEHEPISSVDLMERAAGNAFDRIWSAIDVKSYVSIHIFCGVGNNGGDGLVLARMMEEKGIKAKVYVVEFSNNWSDDFRINLDRLPHPPTFIQNANDVPTIVTGSLVIDAIFGSGLDRIVEGFTADLISAINQHASHIVSIDVPSGLAADQCMPNTRKNTICASLTLTFQYPKLSFFMPENAQYVGDWEIVDIGLHEEFEKKNPTDFHYLTEEDISQNLKVRTSEAYKGNFGHALLHVGMQGKYGAAILASMGCMRSGAGLLTVHLPSKGHPILHSAVPEAMLVNETAAHELGELVLFDAHYTHGVGCGIGQSERTQIWFREFLENQAKPLVLDADALNLIARDVSLFDLIPKGSILSPHLGEFKRLVGEWDDPFDRLSKQKELSKKYELVIILKGRHTSITDHCGHTYFNATGNPGMATAGSGDVLTGILTSFLAQGYSPIDAALNGVFIHGLAGDYAADAFGEECMLASDIIEALPDAFRHLKD